MDVKIKKRKKTADEYVALSAGKLRQTGLIMSDLTALIITICMTCRPSLFTDSVVFVESLIYRISLA